MNRVGEPALREDMSSSIFPVTSHLHISLPFLTREKQREGQELKSYLLLQSKYHVTYFGETVSRAWISVSMLKNFQELSLELSKVVSKLWASFVIQGTVFFLFYFEFLLFILFTFFFF